MQPTQIADIAPEFSHPMQAIYHPRCNPLMHGDVHELMHFKSVVATFFNYISDYRDEEKRQLRSLLAIRQSQRELLKFDYVKVHDLCEIKDRHQRYQECMLANAELLMTIVVGYRDLFEELKHIRTVYDIPPLPNTAPGDIQKVRITLKQFVREWSSEGQQERQQCYSPLIEALCQSFPDASTHTPKYKVVVPGAGLGRIVYELAKLGFSVQGNEFSYFMLIASNFIMNLTSEPNQFTAYPSFSNNNNRRNEKDAFASIRIPDECPSQHINEDDDLSMVAGEFISVYHDQLAQWNAVVTCFFLDTGNNILDYIEHIHKILRKGGVWLNLGPLEYHYSKIMTETSVELSWEEIRHFIERLGFAVTFWEYRDCTYNHHPLEGKKLLFECAYFKAVKQ